jgi:hypothetical protein
MAHSVVIPAETMVRMGRYAKLMMQTPALFGPVVEPCPTARRVDLKDPLNVRMGRCATS